MAELPAGCALLPEGNGIDAFGWRIVSSKFPISSSQATDDFCAETKIKCPEMVYLSNKLVLTHTSGATFSFSTREALLGCLLDESQSQLPQPASKDSKPSPSAAASPIRVASAAVWDKAVHAPVEGIEQVAMNFDWTYTTSYIGSAFFAGEGKQAGPMSPVPTTQELDIELLKRRDPVYWFDNVLLYEDELHDNGISHVSVKVRVMPTFWLVLLRSWLRVDGVVVRVKDARFFHKFGTEEVYREVHAREVTFAEMPKFRLPVDVSLYRDVDQFSPRIPLRHAMKHTFSLRPPTTTTTTESDTADNASASTTASVAATAAGAATTTDAIPQLHDKCEACVMWVKEK